MFFLTKITKNILCRFNNFLFSALLYFILLCHNKEGVQWQKEETKTPHSGKWICYEIV